jgi:hypothetical protein
MMDLKPFSSFAKKSGVPPLRGILFSNNYNLPSSFAKTGIDYWLLYRLALVLARRVTEKTRLGMSPPSRAVFFRAVMHASVRTRLKRTY